MRTHANEIGFDRPPMPVDDGDDRRTATRFTLLIRAAKLVVDEVEFICVIRDASQTGVKLKVYNEIPAGETLQLELANGERFDVEQVWVRDGFAGFRFPDPVALERLIEAERGPFPSRRLRLRTRLEGHVAWGSQSAPASFENISQQGAAIVCGAFLAIDQLVRVETDPLAPIYAKVRWRKGSRYGLIFERTLGFEELARLAD